LAESNQLKDLDGIAFLSDRQQETRASVEQLFKCEVAITKRLLPTQGWL
jgi:hypothetical protein